jgi:hypothetical protein
MMTSGLLGENCGVRLHSPLSRILYPVGLFPFGLNLRFVFLNSEWKDSISCTEKDQEPQNCRTQWPEEAEQGVRRHTLQESMTSPADHSRMVAPLALCLTAWESM